MKKEEFDILYYCYKHRKEAITSKNIIEASGIEEGKALGIIKLLIEHGWLTEELSITDAGIVALQPYKVRNAIILAAGMSTRFVPFSFEKPKGLMVCKGERLIEREIDQLKEAGVEEIVIVVGYMKEQFYYLAEKYGAIIIYNPEYATKNNNASVLVAKNYIGNSYICASDNYYTYNVFESHEYRDFYDSIYGSGSLDERGLFLDDEDRIVKTERPTKDKWLMFGKSYWSFDFTKKFIPILEQAYTDPVLQDYLWEWVWNLHVDEIPFYAKKYPENTILEFDSLDDLREYDPYYVENAGMEIIQELCDAFGCRPTDITKIAPVKNGDPARPFSFYLGEQKYIVHHSLVMRQNAPKVGNSVFRNYESGWFVTTE